MSALKLTAPCTRVDLAEIYGDMHPLAWIIACQQIGMGPSYAIHGPDGRALFVGGFIAAGDCWECWFNAAPEAARHMLALRSLARLTIADLPQSDTRPVETIVRTPAGARIARMLGFTRALTMDGLEIWRRTRWVA